MSEREQAEREAKMTHEEAAEYLDQDIVYDSRKEIESRAIAARVLHSVASARADADALNETQERAERLWRCFHCDFSTSDRVEAEIHFGDGEGSAPICLEWSKMTEDERLSVWVGGEQQLLQAREELAKAREECERLREEIELRNALQADGLFP